jgi:hypothetical protein
MKKLKAAIKPKLLLDREMIRDLKRILSTPDLGHVAGASATSNVNESCTTPK